MINSSLRNGWCVQHSQVAIAKLLFKTAVTLNYHLTPVLPAVSEINEQAVLVRELSIIWKIPNSNFNQFGVRTVCNMSDAILHKQSGTDLKQKYV